MLQHKNFALSALLIATMIVGLGVYFYPRNGSTSSGEAGQELNLVRPAFASEIGIMSTTLDNEAGMSIWLNATAQGNLSIGAAKSFLTTTGSIENITSDYIVGSISLQAQGFTSDDYPHCFVHISGWIVVYFLKINPANPSTTGWIGKAFPMYSPYYANHQLTDNLLHKALVLICQAVSRDPSNAQYYNFQHPSATTLEIAIKTATYSPATATFNVNVPSSFTIDEYSWSYYASYSGSFKIDSTPIASGGGRKYGGSEITASVLSPDNWHIVTIVDNYYYTSDTVTACILIMYH